MTKATLVLLRHGQTPDNVSHFVSGHRDVPLTETGEAEASAAGPLIKDIPFDKVYSSPLSRAVKTTVLALKAAGKVFSVEQRREIIEGNDGELQGLSTKDPVVVDYYKNSSYTSAPPGGESNKHLVARVQKFYDEEVMPRLAKGENVLVVAHYGVICAFEIAVGLAQPPADDVRWKAPRSVPNATPIVHEYEDGVLKKSYAIENAVTTEADKLNSPPVAQKRNSKMEI